MRIGFIGVGGIAARHLDNLEQFDDADVVAVCDIDEETVSSVANERDASAFTNHEAMFSETELDAVFVAIPPFAHDDQERLAAEHDIDLFVEKPVALTAEHALETARALDGAGVVAQVGYAFRYSATVERLRELVDPVDVSFVAGHYTFPGTPPSEWWHEKDLSGGQIVEQSTHIYDLVRHVAGDVNRVSAVGEQRHVAELDFPDTTIATLHHETGVVSQVTSTCAAAEMDAGLRLVGPSVDLTYDLFEDSLTGTIDGEAVDYDSESDVFVNELEAFLETVEAAGTPSVRARYKEGIETLELTLAATEAVDDTGFVQLN